MKTYGGMDVWTHVFSISGLVWGEWSASRPGRFTPGERAPGTHWIGNWVGPRASLHSMHPTTKWLLNYRTVLLLSQMSDYATSFVNNRNDQCMEFCLPMVLKSTDVSEEHPPPSSRSKNKLVYARLILRTWKRRRTCSSETSMVLERTTRHYNPASTSLHTTTSNAAILRFSDLCIRRLCNSAPHSHMSRPARDNSLTL
jgi:hypothetical protein